MATIAKAAGRDRSSSRSPVELLRESGEISVLRLSKQRHGASGHARPKDRPARQPESFLSVQRQVDALRRACFRGDLESLVGGKNDGTVGQGMRTNRSDDVSLHVGV